MRTTDNRFKTLIKDHIKSTFLDEAELKNGYDIETTEENLLKNQLQIIVNEFKSWYGPYEQKRHPNRQDAFIDWLTGLPSCFSVEYSYYNIHETLKGWFEKFGPYKEVKDEPQYYWYLCFREFSALCKKEGVNF